MVKHFVMYKFKDGLSDSDKRIALFNLKKQIEVLNGKIHGLIDVSIETLLLPSSDMDFLTKAQFENENALKTFRDSPIYLPVQNYLEKVVKESHCTDYYD